MIDAVRRANRETREERAQRMRLRRPACKSMNWEEINRDLDEMQEDAYEGQWMSGKYAELDELEGTLDAETVIEMKIAFGDLTDECARMQQDMYDLRMIENGLFEDTNDEYDEPPLLFDCFFPAINYNDRMCGYDIEEHDYYGLEICQEDAAKEAARKRLKRLSKDQLLDCAGMCMEIARQYLSLRARYDGLSTALAVLKGEFEASLEMVTHIESLYEAAERETHGFKYQYGKAMDRFDAALYELPDRIWVE